MPSAKVSINSQVEDPAFLRPAVTSDPAIPLQILAGPGSGKTRVLTSRVAHLVQKHLYKPYEITAVTFTNKAANEMRKRLRALLGEKQADNLVLGALLLLASSC
jgi:DNA helicase-2/ATP-dependent DNA helicase PcrA